MEHYNYKNSFYIEIKFASGDVKYIDSKGKVTDEPNKSSLIATYKAFNRFLSSRKSYPIFSCFISTSGFAPVLDEEHYEHFGYATIKFVENDSPDTVLDVVEYILYKSKHKAFVF